ALRLALRLLGPLGILLHEHTRFVRRVGHPALVDELADVTIVAACRNPVALPLHGGLVLAHAPRWSTARASAATRARTLGERSSPRQCPEVCRAARGDRPYFSSAS